MNWLISKSFTFTLVLENFLYVGMGWNFIVCECVCKDNECSAEFLKFKFKLVSLGDIKL